MTFLSSRWLRYVVLLAIVIALGFGIKVRYFTPEPPPRFTTAQAVRKTIEANVLATGTIEAYRLVSVGAQVSGQLKALYVELGDQVEQGQLIAEIDSMTQQNALRNAEAAQRTVEARRRAQEAALKQAQLEFKRQKTMLAQNASSRQEYEAAEANLQTIQAQLAALDAELSQAAIAVDTARVNLGYTQIRAPMSGTVVSVVAQEGQTLNANQQAPTIIRLAQLDTITVKAEISEADVVRVKPGMPVYFTILGDQNKQYHATLRTIEPAPEALMKETTSAASSSSSSSTAVYYNGLFDIPNPDGRLRIGMTAQVTIVLDRAENAVVVPSSAVQTDPRGRRTFVRVLDDQGEPEVRFVKVGLNNNVEAQILEGLAPGDVVVTGSGQGAARPPQQNAARAPRLRF